MTRVIINDGDELKTDDTAPSLDCELVKNNGVAQDLTDFTVSFRMREAGADDVVVDDDDSGNVSIDDSAGGRVTYDWQPTDTETAATYDCEFEIDDSNGVVKSFPNQGFFTVQIEEGIN